MTLLVTGCAGFIGSNFVLDWLAESHETVVNLDKLTYAGNLQNWSPWLTAAARLPALGRMLWLIPGHCDPTVNLYDFLIGVRGGLMDGVVERIIRVDARGALT